MWGIVVAGLVFIGMGLFTLLLPDVVRDWEETRNSYKGIESDHGDRYRTGLVVRGIVMVLAGIVIITMPFWVRALV